MFFFSSRRRHTRYWRDWSSDVCSSDLSSTTLASKPFTVTTGTWYTLRIEANGTSLSAYVNGALQLTATDGQFASGNIGGATFNATAVFDDFVVTTLTGPPPTPTQIGRASCR